MKKKSTGAPGPEGRHSVIASVRRGIHLAQRLNVHTLRCRNSLSRLLLDSATLCRVQLDSCFNDNHIRRLSSSVDDHRDQDEKGGGGHLLECSTRSIPRCCCVGHFNPETSWCPRGE